MKHLWDRIHVWLAANAPEVLAGLRRPATAKQVRAAEKAMGVTLPDDVKAAYCIHDGEEVYGKAPSPGALSGWRWMTLQDMAEHGA
jgi:cell wall assembly regulator SMI1